MTDIPTSEQVADAATEAGKSGFVTKTLNIFRHTEGSIAEGIAKATEKGKPAEVLDKIGAIKPGSIRWGRVGIAAGIAAVGAFFIAGIGNKGPGKYAEQEASRTQSQPGMSVA